MHRDITMVQLGLTLCPQKPNIIFQRGSEIQPFEICNHLKSALFEGLISNGPALAMDIAIV